MTRALVSLNAGSSSIKFALYTLDDVGAPTCEAHGKIEAIGTAPRMAISDARGNAVLSHDWPDGAALSHEALLGTLLDWIEGHLSGHALVAIGHRVVHGGAGFAAPVRIDADVLSALDALCPLAPLHQPHNLAAIRAVAAIAPKLPQVACFDTAFHHGMPSLATRLPLPRALHDAGVRRYGFHGLSYDYVARRLREIDPRLAGGRVIAAHLGNGASMCAMKAGRSIDTTMGFTALDGLMMGTRSGSLDPGVILHLETQRGMSADQVSHLLYQESGLLGVSGLSSDMRDLKASGAPEAEEAMALFALRAARCAGSLMTSLRGLDGIVFTAGIGENDPDMRRRICAHLEWAGVVLDEEANSANAGLVSAAASAVTVRVLPTDEERMIALQTVDLLGLDQEKSS